MRKLPMNEKNSHAKITSEIKPKENTLLALKLLVRIFVAKPSKVKLNNK